jgi:lipopolysaccharide assembly protein B
MVGFFLALIVLVFVVGAIMIVLRSKRTTQEDDQALYYEGLSLLILGNTKAAYQKFKDVVQSNSERIDAYIHLGNILRDQKNYPKALVVHKNLLMRPVLSSADKAMVLKAIAEDHLAAVDRDNAIAALEELKTLAPKDPWAQQQLLTLYEKAKQWEKAFETKKLLLKLNNQKDDVLLALYKVYEGLELAGQDEHQARLRFRDALNIDPKCAAAYYHLGASYYREDRKEDAIAEWKKLIAKIPEYAYLTFDLLGKTFYEKGDFTETENMLRLILKNNPRDIHTIMALVEILDKKGTHQEELDLCQEALAIDPQAIGVYCKMLRYQKFNPYALEESLKKMEQTCHLNRPFTCGVCHYQSAEPFWRCPQCEQWQTLK